MPDGTEWKLEGFLDRVELWEKNEPASAAIDTVRLAVLDWIMSRYVDPYQGVRREPGFDNFWFGPIPGTEHDGQVVCCSYWIQEATRTVRCDLIQTLSSPV